MALSVCPHVVGMRCPHYHAACDDDESIDCLHITAATGAAVSIVNIVDGLPQHLVTSDQIKLRDRMQDLLGNIAAGLP